MLQAANKIVHYDIFGEEITPGSIVAATVRYYKGLVPAIVHSLCDKTIRIIPLARYYNTSYLRSPLDIVVKIKHPGALLPEDYYFCTPSLSQESRKILDKLIVDNTGAVSLSEVGPFEIEDEQKQYDNNILCICSSEFHHFRINKKSLEAMIMAGLIAIEK